MPDPLPLSTRPRRGPTHGRGIAENDAVEDMLLPQVRSLGLVDDARFNKLATNAARLGPSAIPDLMLIARDGPDPYAQLCAIKALGLMRHPAAVEARRRISLLKLDGDRGRMVRGAFPNPPVPFDEPWNVLDVTNTLYHDRWEQVAEAKRLGKRPTVSPAPAAMTRAGMGRRHAATGMCNLSLCLKCRGFWDNEAWSATLRAHLAASAADERARREAWEREHPVEAAQAKARRSAWEKAHPQPVIVGGTALMLLAFVPALLFLPVYENLERLDPVHTVIAGLVGASVFILMGSGFSAYAGGRGSTTQFRAPSKRVWRIVALLCLPQLVVDILAIASPR